MRSARILAAATYGEITRRPLYYILLLSFAAGILLSRMITLFSFYQEMNLVREMGLATIALWTFLIVVIHAGIVVTQELEDRTAVTLLSKPLRRSDFLLGKFGGILLSLVPGTAFLAGVLLLTLFLMGRPLLPVNDSAMAEEVARGSGAFAAALRLTWEGFVLRQGGAVVVEGAFLSLLQGAVLAAVAVSLSAFLPGAVSVAATTLVFVLGNISSYMVASVERMGGGFLPASVRGLALLFPNFGYFNLQAHFSEGRIISLNYLGFTFAYAVLYVSAVFLVSCSLFRGREVR